MCVAYMDIDNFKKVNDFFGHGEGNNVLKRIGTAIVETVRSDDLKARVGGDEFAFVFNCQQVAIAEALGKRLVERIGRIGLEYPGTRLGASLGIAFFPHVPDRLDGILRTADDLMFQAKAAGKGTVVVSVIDPNRRSLLT